MEKKKTKMVVAGIILIVFLVTMGISYAIWQITMQQTSSNIITTGCFQIEFSDINPINLQRAYPITDEEGKILTPYEFTITNTCNSFASFQINLEILNTTTLENLDYLKVMLDDRVNILTENDVVTKTLENAKNSYKLKTGYLRENQSKTFSLRLWMDEDTPTREEFMDKLFESKVTIIAAYKENLDNTIEVNAISQNENFSGSETFQIHAISENYDLVSISEDLETWEELETKGKDVTVEKIVTANGIYTYYFQDEAENVQEVTVTATKIDDKKPVANMSVTKSNNVISIDASGSLDNETDITKYYYSKDGINYEESLENSFQFTNEYEYGVATTMLTNFEANQIKKVYLKVEDEVGNMSDVKEISITESDFAYDETADNNLRYIGASPNNYVTFNDELWRIIGVMNNIDDGTGKNETRIKLIRNESIGEYSWDTSASNVNSGHGVNEWSQADAMKLLNPGYEGESVGGSLYWNRGVGNCYSYYTNTTTACNFSETGLKESSKAFISQAVWHTGANGSAATYENIVTSKMYELERSNNTGKICSSGLECTDKVTRTTIWKGIVGLMHLSDYGYATSGGSTINRKACLDTILFYWDGANVSDCKNNDWLYNSNAWQWTINPYSFSDRARNVFYINSSGRGGCDQAYNNQSAVLPTIYLKANVKIMSGIGIELQPFVLSLN